MRNTGSSNALSKKAPVTNFRVVGISLQASLMALKEPLKATLSAPSWIFLGLSIVSRRNSSLTSAAVSMQKNMIV